MSRDLTSKSSTRQANDDDLNLVEIDGADGNFWVAFTGVRCEEPFGFYYRDSRAQFGFYADVDRNTKAWNVSRTSTGVWTGAYFKTTADNEAIVRKNIAFFLETRDALEPAKLKDRSADPTIFSWKIIQ